MIYEPEQIEAFAFSTLSASTAAETQLSLGGGRMTVARLADNIIQESTTQQWLEVELQVAFGRRGRWHVGAARANRLTSEELERLMRWASEAALASPLQNDYVAVPRPTNFEYTPDISDAYDITTAGIGPAFRANELARVALPCRRLGYRSWGHYAVSEGSLGLDGTAGLIAVANSEGLFQFHLPTTVHFETTVETPSGGIGFARVVGHRARSLDVESAAQRAIRDAEHPVSSNDAFGTHTVVLDAPAVARLLAGLAPHLSYAYTREGRSALGRLSGDAAASEAVTLRVDSTHELLRERPFDRDGWPRHPISLLDRGRIDTLLHDRAEAMAQGIEPSGYSDVGGVGVRPDHLILEGGDGGDVDDLVSEAGRGILIRDFTGPISFERPGLFARGVVPVGAFSIEGGRVSTALRNVHFELELTALLDSLSRLGTARRVDSFVAPPLLGEGFVIYEGRD